MTISCRPRPSTLANALFVLPWAAGLALTLTCATALAQEAAPSTGTSTTDAAAPIAVQAIRVTGVGDHPREQIDPALEKAMAPAHSLQRVEVVLRAILRAGAYELMSRRDVPARVVISEYVDVAHSFYGGDEPGMVNGVLDKVARDVRGNEFAGLPASGRA